MGGGGIIINRDEPSPLGMALLQMFEDYSEMAYQDQHGVWTCGWGHTGPDVKQGTTCSEAEAEAWLKADIGAAVGAVKQVASFLTHQHQFDALVSFTYNVGVQAFARSHLLTCLKNGQLDLAAEQFEAWVHVGAVSNKGLIRRRRVEKALFLDGGV